MIRAMRKEPFLEGHIVHVIKRGARGADIFVDESDKWQFLRALFILNDTYKSNDWRRETLNLPLFVRPKQWPGRDPLTRILAWTLMPNHIHLVLQETKAGGISKFMQRLGGSMTLAFNTKYKNQGSIFQGSYKAKKVEDDDYLKYLIFYVLVKNVFELFPGGIQSALNDFEKSWIWAMTCPFSSFRLSVRGLPSPILDDPQGLIENAINKNNFSKTEIFEMLKSYLEKEQIS